MPQILYKLPKGWEWRKFIECCVLKRGYDLPKRLRNEGSYPLFSANGVTDYIDQFKVNGLGVVTGRSGTIGQVHFVDRDYWPLNTALYVKNFCGNDERFVCYFLKSFDLKRFASGAAVPTLNRNSLSSELIAFPDSKLEQERIVEKLDALFSRIDAATARLNQILTHSKALFASSLKNQMTAMIEQYGEGKVSDCLDNIQTGTTPPTKEKKYYDGGNMDWYAPPDFGAHKILVNSKKKITEQAFYDGKAKHFQAGTIMLVAIGATIGKIGLLKEPASSNQQITGMHFNQLMYSEFAYYWFVHIKEVIIARSSAATLPIINQKGIKALPLCVPPPLEEQQRIVEHLDGLSSRIQTLEKTTHDRLKHLATLKASLLDSAFRGKL